MAGILQKFWDALKKKEGCIYNDNYIVSWAVGHLVSLCEPEEYDAVYKSWRFDHLPIIPREMRLKILPETEKQFEILKKLMNSKAVDSLVCATDSGREGELIFRYIYKMAGCSKPFMRLWISSMTDEAIKEGFEKLKPGTEYDNLYYSARCRSEADWLVGMNASRAFTIRYNALLSVGRVQTPTLAIIAARQKEIDNFIPVEYFEVQVNYGSLKGTWYDKEVSNTRISDEEKAKQIQEKVKGKNGLVTEIIREKKQQPFPQLYDLTELQRDANRRFGFSAKKTLSIAQSLYEKHKLITYPRTDSRYLTTDMVSTIKPTLECINIPPYSQYIEKLLNLPHLPAGKRLVDNNKVSDHHAIIPSKRKPDLKKLTEDERKIYDYVVRRFIAVFYPPLQFETTGVHICVADETFYSSGKLITDPGWKVLYADDDKQGDEDQILPDVKKGDIVAVHDSTILKKKTTPPKPYTEAGLLSAMENAGRFVEDEELKEQLKDSGIGTPATRAAIIERLISVGYIARKGKSLIPTSKGISLIEIVPEELKSPETTGKWERALSNIARGSMEPKKFMNSIERYVNYIIESARVKKSGVVFPQEKRYYNNQTNEEKRKTSKKQKNRE